MRWTVLGTYLLTTTLLACYPSDGLQEKIDVLLQAEHDGETAVSVAVVRRGEIVYAGTLGFEDRAKDVMATEDSVFNLASVTKTITSVAVLQLVQDGKLSLDEKLSAILEGVPDSWSDITVLQMLSHTSGIMDYARHPDGRQIVFEDHSVTEVRETVLSWDLEFDAGEKWAYSNSAFNLLGHVVAAKSGSSYAEYLKTRIFDPAGMSTAVLESYGETVDHRVVGLDESGGAAPFVNPNWSFGAGAVTCSAEDMAKFDIAVHSGKLLSADLLKLAQTPRGGEKPAGIFGLGWIINEHEGMVFVGHIGGKPGFDAAYLRQPDKDVSVIVLKGRSGGSALRTAEKIMGLLLDD